MNTPSSPIACPGTGRIVLAMGWAALFGMAGEAHAVVFADNLNRRQDGLENISRSRWLGSKFTTDGENYLLTDVIVRLQRSLPGFAEASLYSDDNGKPGKLIAVLKGNGEPGARLTDVIFSGDIGDKAVKRQLTSQLTQALPDGLSQSDLPSGEFAIGGKRPAGVGLEPNSAYWVVTRAKSGEFAQAYTDTETGKGIGFTPEWAVSENGGASWTTKDFNPLIFSANGELDVALLQLRTDAEAIASAIYSGLPVALLQTQLALSNTEMATRDVNSRLFRHRAGKQGAPGVEVFATGQFVASDVDAALHATGAQGDSFTSTVGVEWRPTAHIAMGLALTHLESEHSLSYQLGDVDVSGNSIAAYGSFTQGGAYADLLYAYTSLRQEIRRNTLFGNTAKAEPGSGTHKIELNFGYNKEAGGFLLGVFGGLEYVNGSVNGYTERGGGTANVHVPQQDLESLVSRIGFGVSKSFDVRGVEVTPQVRVAWAHEFLNEPQTLEARLELSPFEIGDGFNFQRIGSFKTSADTHPGARDWVEFGAGVHAKFSERFTVLCDYEARVFQGDGQMHSVSILGSWRF